MRILATMFILASLVQGDSDMSVCCVGSADYFAVVPPLASAAALVLEPGAVNRDSTISVDRPVHVQFGGVVFGDWPV